MQKRFSLKKKRNTIYTLATTTKTIPQLCSKLISLRINARTPKHLEKKYTITIWNPHRICFNFISFIFQSKRNIFHLLNAIQINFPARIQNIKNET